MTSLLEQKRLVLMGIAALALVGTFLLPAIPQDPAYHNFADQSTHLGIPNCWNVLSNLPFLLVGIAGIGGLHKGKLRILPELRPAYLAFFIGVALVGPGSGYYHLAPDNDRLVWDRLPMTLAFMAFFPIIVAEYISIPAGRRLLWPLLLAGLGSVLYWHVTERQGHGDLRFYGLIQFLPMLLIPLIMLMFQPRFTGTGFTWALLGAYAAAKLAEWLDEPIFHILDPLSGHALKHLLAALGVLAWLITLRNRADETNPTLLCPHKRAADSTECQHTPHE